MQKKYIQDPPITANVEEWKDGWPTSEVIFVDGDATGTYMAYGIASDQGGYGFKKSSTYDTLEFTEGLERVYHSTGPGPKWLQF